MTEKEIQEKIKKLEKELKVLKEQISNPDEIFLLSIEEYKKYKEFIPVLNHWWWLRSPGYGQYDATLVRYFGRVYAPGRSVYYEDGVRPALRVNYDEKKGKRFVKYMIPWIYLGDGIAISEFLIGSEKFDDESNNYDKSHIRAWLLNWLENRKKECNG